MADRSFRIVPGILLLLVIATGLRAQLGPTTTANGPVKDTSLNKTNNGQWKNEEARLYYRKLNSNKDLPLDTGIHTFHRLPLVQPWQRDMGNLGSPTLNLMFTPENRVGPTLGYHTYDIYRFDIGNLDFYNTTRPYSVFRYRLGSRLEQVASLLHTQNILPNWNFMVEYRKTNSPGFYKTQRNNHDNVVLTTNYQSQNKRYTVYAGLTYNKEQHDENGGILNDSDLNNAAYTDRKTIATAYQNASYSLTRSPVTNVQRDFSVLFQHGYTWGRTDTTYNKDSTQFSIKLVPRFSITHKVMGSTEKHTYKDLSPDSLRYADLFVQSFSGPGSYYSATRDSLYAQQKWNWIDNQVLLNGFLGKENNQLRFSIGAGNRYDEFITQPAAVLIPDSLPNHVYTIGLDRNNIFSNYITGELRKEALAPGQWEYAANAKFFATGDYAGNFELNALISKELKKLSATFTGGFEQRLSSAPYSYTLYANNYITNRYSFNQESITRLYATLDIPKWRLWGGVSNYLVGNYIYIAETQKPVQDATAFNLLQVWARKVFEVGNFYLDNEVVYQVVPDAAPVNIPAVMGKEQLSYERSMFKNALKIATGVEMRYTTAYTPAGYSAILNRFYYHQGATINNMPEMAVFFNFRVKRFRAFFMVDQLQQLFDVNATVFTSPKLYNETDNRTYSPVYATPDVTIRFGFNWAMVN